MLEFHNMFIMQIFLLCLMLIGVIVVKTRIMGDARARASMTDLVIYVLLPCNILSSFFGTSRSQIPSLGIMLVISLGIMTLSLLLSRVLYRKATPEQKKVLFYATLISNAVLLGNPVVESIYGLEGLSYAAVYMLPFRLATWTLGLAIFTGRRGNLIKAFLHPCVVTVFLGLLVIIVDFTPPVLVSRLIFSLGSCTTPLSMIVAGCILATVDPRKIWTKLTIYFTFIRLVLIPLMVMGILLVFRPAPMIAGISVILCGMPAGVTTSILADKYGADSELASKIAFVSTLLSIITAPLLAWLLQRSL